MCTLNVIYWFLLLVGVAWSAICVKQIAPLGKTEQHAIGVGASDVAILLVTGSVNITFSDTYCPRMSSGQSWNVNLYNSSGLYMSRFTNIDDKSLSWFMLINGDQVMQGVAPIDSTNSTTGVARILDFFFVCVRKWWLVPLIPACWFVVALNYVRVTKFCSESTPLRMSL